MLISLSLSHSIPLTLLLHARSASFTYLAIYWWSFIMFESLWRGVSPPYLQDKGLWRFSEDFVVVCHNLSMPVMARRVPPLGRRPESDSDAGGPA